MVSLIVAPRNGGVPVSISKSTQPNAQMSAALVDRVSARLLRAHVGRGPENRPGCGPRAAVVDRLDVAGVRRAGLGQAEVEDLRRRRSVVRVMFAGFRSRWMKPRLVRGLQRVGDLPRDRQRLSDRQRAARDPLRERAPSTSSRIRRGRRRRASSESVDGADVRMIQRRRAPRLAFEAREAIGIGREELGQHLDRDVASEPRIARAIDLAHPACAERAGDLVRAEPGARPEWHAA